MRTEPRALYAWTAIVALLAGCAGTSQTTPGEDGFVVIDFIIQRDGSVEDPRVITSEPSDKFDEAALEALRKWKYRPRSLAKRARVRLSFKLDENEEPAIAAPIPNKGSNEVAIERPTPLYPRDARDRGITGYVVVKFVIQPTGEASDAEIVSSEPPGVFDQVALEAFSKWKWRPFEGPPKKDQTVKLTFVLPE